MLISGLNFLITGKSVVEADLDEGAKRGHESPDVVTEAGAGRAQIGGKQLREIDGVTPEERKLTKTHDRHEYEDLPQIV